MSTDDILRMIFLLLLLSICLIRLYYLHQEMREMDARIGTCKGCGNYKWACKCKTMTEKESGEGG